MKENCKDSLFLLVLLVWGPRTLCGSSSLSHVFYRSILYTAAFLAYGGTFDSAAVSGTPEGELVAFAESHSSLPIVLGSNSD